jgi:hypothetical protein
VERGWARLGNEARIVCRRRRRLYYYDEYGLAAWRLG